MKFWQTTGLQPSDCDGAGFAQTFELIELREDGDTYTRRQGGPHDEGSSYTERHYEREGESVRLTVSECGQDCDGKHSSVREYTCHRVDLARVAQTIGVEAGIPGVRFPRWTEVRHDQRDHTAEAAGY